MAGIVAFAARKMRRLATFVGRNAHGRNSLAIATFRYLPKVLTYASGWDWQPMVLPRPDSTSRRFVEVISNDCQRIR